jgi:uncharacterized LabA/DUF88 family protein
MRTAILIDGGFFLKRYSRIQGKRNPKDAAKALHRMCLDHLRPKQAGGDESRKPVGKLYRIFYYDCPPCANKTHHPITGTAMDYSKTATAAWRFAFLEELKTLRKVALRMGYLSVGSASWNLRPEAFKDLIKGRRSIDELKEQDVQYSIRQKGVDMRLGLDIASLSYKRQVDQIILVAGDSDFVPAAKLARREGIDFILDPMWAPIRPDLHEHIDGLRSVLPRPKKSDRSSGV